MERYSMVQQIPVGQSGFCRIESDSVDGWRFCRLVELSVLGLDIDVEHLNSIDLIGRPITVDITPFDGSIDFRLEGRIRRVIGLSAGAVRIHIEFAGLSAPTLYELETLARGGLRLVSS